MRRMIITGATSMLGAALTNECIRRGTEVVAIAHRGSKKLSAVPRGDLVTLIEARSAISARRERRASSEMTRTCSART